MKERVTEPRIYSVEAYVVEKYDECPPCPPNGVCDTCVYGIYVADENRPRKPRAAPDDGICLRTNEAKTFQVGARYLLQIRYRIARNRAGGWVQEGPELIDYSRIVPAAAFVHSCK